MLLALVNVGCKNDEETSVPKHNVSLALEIPQGCSMNDISELKITFTEENQKKKTEFTSLKDIVLPRGMYSVSVSCVMKVGVKRMVCTGLTQNINLTENAQKINVKLSAQSQAVSSSRKCFLPARTMAAPRHWTIPTTNTSRLPTTETNHYTPMGCSSFNPS